jgi:hypothetical protein
MTSDLVVLLIRELDALRREVDLYPTDASVWNAIPGAPNVGGTLVLHLVGNLRYFIGSAIGRGGYVRDREAEFAVRDVTRAELLTLIVETRREVEAGLSHLSESMLEAPFPVAVGGRSMSTRLFLLHLLSHLAYHLGQIDYHRRVVTGDAASANALPLSGLGVAAPSFTA